METALSRVITEPSKTVLGMETELCVMCPHCNNHIVISKIRCGIFRHGVMKKTNKPIHPHTNKTKCDKLTKSGLIYGCGKPFRLVKNKETQTVDVYVCDYETR